MKGFVLLAILFQSAAALVISNTTDTDNDWGWGDKAKGTTKGKSKHKNEDPVLAATNNNGGAPIFYAVIMGRLAFRHQVSLWLSSLRKIGGWHGEAVIVTDRPTCLAETLKEAKVIATRTFSNDAVDIWTPAEGYEGNLHVVKRPLAHSINMMKLEKARGWLNVRVANLPHKVSSIVYTDEDVAIGRDLTDFMRQVRALEEQRHTLALFRDTGASAGELHTGVVVMFPGARTDQCLQAWGKKLTGVQIGSARPQMQFSLEDAQEEALNEDNNIDADDSVIKENQLMAEELEVMGPDQQALGRTKPCKQGPDSQGIKILPARFFWLPTAGGLASLHRAEFVHFTNTGRWKNIPHGKIRSYLTRLGVPGTIDPTGRVQALNCAIPEGGTITDVKKGPTNYKKGAGKRRWR